MCEENISKNIVRMPAEKWIWYTRKFLFICKHLKSHWILILSLWGRNYYIILKIKELRFKEHAYINKCERWDLYAGLTCLYPVCYHAHQVPCEYQYQEIQSSLHQSLKAPAAYRVRCCNSVDKVETMYLTTAHSPKAKETEPEEWSGKLDNGSFFLLLELNCVWLWTETEDQSVTFFSLWNHVWFMSVF